METKVGNLYTLITRSNNESNIVVMCTREAVSSGRSKGSFSGTTVKTNDKLYPLGEHIQHWNPEVFKEYVGDKTEIMLSYPIQQQINEQLYEQINQLNEDLSAFQELELKDIQGLIKRLDYIESSIKNSQNKNPDEEFEIEKLSETHMALRRFAEWVVYHKRSVFLDADISLEDAKLILVALNTSSDVLYG